MYEWLLYNQPYPYYDEIFSELKSGFCEDYNTEQSLRSVTEKWRKVLDIDGDARALLFDLTKTFDCIDQELLIAKLNVYVLDSWSLYLLTSIIENKEQKKQTLLIVILMKSLLVSNKDIYWFHCSLIYITVTYL